MAIVDAIPLLGLSLRRPGAHARAGVAIDVEDDVVGLGGVVSGLPVLLVPPVGVETTMAHQHDGPTGGPDVFGQVLLEEGQRGLRVVPDGVVFNGRMLDVGGIKAELDEVDVIPIPRGVQSIGREIRDEALLFAELVSFDEFGLEAETALLLTHRRAVMVAPTLLGREGQLSVATQDPEVSGVERELLAANHPPCYLGVSVVDQVAQGKDRPWLRNESAAEFLGPRQLLDAVHLRNGRGIEGVMVALRMVFLAVMLVGRRQERDIARLDGNDGA